jgi:NADH-quinone oxidoreductase subunit L
MTHAFFKALLFLGSGAVIHAMHEEQDIRNMGALKAALPVTSLTFLIGTVAIAGIPPLAGFFSKDEILWRAFSSGHLLLWLMGLVGAILTAFYMFRLYYLTFSGEKRWEAGKHPHEAPWTMTVPLMILALLSVIGGFVGIPISLGGGNGIEHWLDPIFERANMKLALEAHEDHMMEYALMVLSVAVAGAGIIAATRWYRTRSDAPDRLAARLSKGYTLLLNKYYIDEVYDAVIVTPLVKGSEKLLWKIVDVNMIDWLVNGSARFVGGVSRTVRVVQTGIVQNYVVIFLAGVLAVVGWLIAK